MIDIAALDALPAAEFTNALEGIFEHSPWVPAGAAALRPFGNGIALHRALCRVVQDADPARKLALICAHPELAGRAAIRGELTDASTREQRGAGLSACTPEQYARLLALNAEYHGRFGFPFILAVKGHTPDSVIAALAERVTHDAQAEQQVALEQIFRIARFRLADLVDEPVGSAIMAMTDDLATLSEAGDALTCTYLTPTHRATAQRILDYMRAAGLAAHIDAVGNVVGVLEGAAPSGPGRAQGAAPTCRVLTGSHYDTVINAGRYDGRLGILLPIAVAGVLRRAGRTPPFALEIIAFAEEEGVRFKSTFLGSRAVAGRFESAVLDVVDAAGISVREAIAGAGQDPDGIASLARDPAEVACFVEVHIEQGPVLLESGHGVGVVTSIAGSIRDVISVTGLSGHAGTVPMGLRRDAAAAAAEMVLAVERRCSGTPGLVGTVGQLNVPGGATNVIPGRCEFTLDIRSGDDAVRDAAVAEIQTEFERIASRRQVEVSQRRVLEVPSVPCAPALRAAWTASIERVTGRPAVELPSGAGHDAMMMAGLAAMGMLFVRCGNGGISHHPAEIMSVADADLAARVFEDFLLHYEVPG
jgi:allantoate deiminase/N-carbamoyl-L-amino-acid hydrolase